MDEPESKLITIFGKPYDYREIKHVAGAFFDTARLLRDISSIIPTLVERREAERNKKVPFKRILRWYRRRSHCHPYLVPDKNELARQLAHARYAVQLYREALYVAGNGPLFRPLHHIDVSARTVFDRVLDNLEEIIKPLVNSIPPEWEDLESWDVLSPRGRCSKMIPVYLAALQHRHDTVITTDRAMRIDENVELRVDRESAD